MGPTLVGVLSDRDLLAFADRSLDGELVFPTKPVSDAMTTRPFTARYDASVAALARLMLDARIDCIPVVTRSDELVGLVTSSDLLELLSDPGEHAEPLPFTFALEAPGAEPVPSPS